MRRYKKNIPAFLESRMGKPRSLSFEISNLGSFNIETIPPTKAFGEWFSASQFLPLIVLWLPRRRNHAFAGVVLSQDDLIETLPYSQASRHMWTGLEGQCSDSGGSECSLTHPQKVSQEIPRNAA